MPDATAGDLHSLLGVAPDLPAERLRLAYEAQMNAAVRGHDHRRALALSQAYDALPAVLRRAMYAASVPEDRWLPAPGRAPARRDRLRRRRRARLPGDDPRWRTPVIVLLAVAGAAGFLWWLGVLPALLRV